MIIGYSFWGFLGPGITDTPDGGRSHRRPLVDALAANGHQLVFLQADRDRIEANDPLGGRYRFEPGLPHLDVLFLEWRWPIPGRNTTPCGTPGHTCDLHRQDELLGHYTRARRTPTVIWDKDRQLGSEDPLRNEPHVVICEAALFPSPGAISLLFPVQDERLDTADPRELTAGERPLTLAYVGNQCDRDAAFDRLFAPAAAEVSHVVAGKWPRTEAWPHINFTGRVPFGAVDRIYRTALATLLLVPDRYAAAGQMTQRIFEAVLAGCLPLMPTNARGAERFAPRALHVRDGHEVIARLDELRSLAGTAAHRRLLAACIERLATFRLSTQITVLEHLLKRGNSRPAQAR